jgi:hypothetical protein
LVASGFTLQPTVNLRRTLEAESGAQAEVAFTVIRPAFELFPECRMQVLTHHTPEHMWQQRYVAQPSGIVGLDRVSLVVPNFADTTARFSRFVGRGDGALVLDRGSIHVNEADSRTGAPHITALGLLSRDNDLTAHVMTERGVAVKRQADTLIIAPVDALGVALIIRSA